MIDKVKLLSWRPLPHILFWVVSFYFIGSYFSVAGTLSSIDYLYSISFHLCLVPLVYLNLGLLIPRLLQEKHYFSYILGLIISMIITVAIHFLVFEILIPLLLIDYYIVSFVDTFSLLIIFSIYVGITSLLKFSKSWFRIQQLEKENIEFELSSLKEQLNPHFLFNGLNSIYALSLQKNEKTPEAVLMLSELLRFSLYESNREKVELTLEIRNIEHYIALQKLRLKNPESIRFSITGVPENTTIAPMLLLPILENAFKHGDLEQPVFIRLRIDKTISFSCENEIDKKDHPDRLPGGIGLENIQRRLHLLYPKHSFSIIRNDSRFTVNLVVEVK